MGRRQPRSRQRRRRWERCHHRVTWSQATASQSAVQTHGRRTCVTPPSALCAPTRRAAPPSVCPASHVPSNLGPGARPGAGRARPPSIPGPRCRRPCHAVASSTLAARPGLASLPDHEPRPEPPVPRPPLPAGRERKVPATLPALYSRTARAPGPVGTGPKQSAGGTTAQTSPTELRAAKHTHIASVHRASSGVIKTYVQGHVVFP